MNSRTIGGKAWTILALALVAAATDRASAKEYVAFSLREAQRLVQAHSDDFRETQKEAYTLGGITAVQGLIYDAESNDLILVGERFASRPALTLDDFAVALRARFVYGHWPLVSIDPTPDTKTTNMQHVRFEGGIENTAFGRDLFEADLLLKKIGMGLSESGVPGLRRLWDIETEQLRKGEGARQWHIGSRFWFYPADPSVPVRGDVVAMSGPKVQVFTEVLSATVNGKAMGDVHAFRYPEADHFADEVSRRLEELADRHEPIARLVGLFGLVGVGCGLEAMDPRPDADYWLAEYAIEEAATPTQQEVLRNRYHQGGGRCEVSGGVYLAALAMRLNAGDTAALKKVVLMTRPEPHRLTWAFVVGEWVIPVDAGGPIPREAVGPLFDCATFLLGHKRFEDAVSTLDRIIGAAPDLGEAWHDRAEAYRLQGDWASAIRDYDQAIARDPNLALSYKGRAIAYVQGREDPIRGLIDIEKALSVRPLDAECHTWRGIALAKLGEYKEALWAYDKALALAPELTKVLCEKALCLSLLGRSHEALACTEQALLQEPSDPKVWYAEGLVLGSAGRWEEGLRAFQTALDIDPEYLDAWLNRAFALAALGRRREALSACDRALSSHPEVAAVWRTKAQVLTLMGDRRGATACLETAHKCGAEK